MATHRINGLPWASGIGVDVKDCTTSREVMQQAKLDWTVKKCELMAKMPFTINGNNEINEIDALNGSFSKDGNVFRNLPDAYATYRTDKNIPLGLVKSKYEVVQNIEAFNFFDEAIGPNLSSWESAGCLGYGHKIFVTAKMSFAFDVDDGTHKDPIENYLVFSNSHDGTSSITIMFTPIRVFCTNCLNAGLDKSESYIRIRHTESAKDKLHKGVEILRIACEKAKEAKQLYDALYTVKMTDVQVLEYLANLNLTDKERQLLLEYDSVTGYDRILQKEYMAMERTGISTRKANVIQSMYDYYRNGVAQAQIAGTAWGAYNAVTGYFSNEANLEGDKRIESLLYGNAQNFMNRAINSAASLIKVA